MCCHKNPSLPGAVDDSLHLVGPHWNAIFDERLVIGAIIGRPRGDLRPTFEAALRVHGEEIPWRALPTGYGSWSVVLKRFNRLVELGVVTRLEALANQPKLYSSGYVLSERERAEIVTVCHAFIELATRAPRYRSRGRTPHRYLNVDVPGPDDLSASQRRYLYYFVAPRRWWYATDCSPVMLRDLRALHWLCRNGGQWKRLPSELGSYEVLRRKFRKWKIMGLWASIEGCLDGAFYDNPYLRRRHRHQPEPEDLDSTLRAFVRAMVLLTEAQRPGEHRK